MSAKNIHGKFIDLNLLPEKYRPQRMPLRLFVIWLLILLLLIPIFPTGNLYAERQVRVSGLNEDLNVMDNKLNEFKKSLAEVNQLKNNLTKIQLQNRELQGDFQFITNNRFSKATIFSKLMRETNPQIKVLSVQITGERIIIDGQADDFPTLSFYLDKLKNSGSFIDVSLVSTNSLQIGTQKKLGFVASMVAKR